MSGGYLTVNQALIGKIPIPKITDDQARGLLNAVNKIVGLTEGDNFLKDEKKRSLVKEYERKIDLMVYKLYGLTKYLY